MISKKTNKAVLSQAAPAQRPKPTQMAVAQPTVHYGSLSEPSAPAPPTHEEIALRAYQIYVENGRPEGQSEQIWRQAEQELQSRSRTFLSR